MLLLFYNFITQQKFQTSSTFNFELQVAQSNIPLEATPAQWIFTNFKTAGYVFSIYASQLWDTMKQGCGVHFISWTGTPSVIDNLSTPVPKYTAWRQRHESANNCRRLLRSSAPLGVEPTSSRSQLGRPTVAPPQRVRICNKYCTTIVNKAERWKDNRRQFEIKQIYAVNSRAFRTLCTSASWVIKFKLKSVTNIYANITGIIIMKKRTRRSRWRQNINTCCEWRNNNAE